jgi:hypothetical protein
MLTVHDDRNGSTGRLNRNEVGRLSHAREGGSSLFISQPSLVSPTGLFVLLQSVPARLLIFRLPGLTGRICFAGPAPFKKPFARSITYTRVLLLRWLSAVPGGNVVLYRGRDFDSSF